MSAFRPIKFQTIHLDLPKGLVTNNLQVVHLTITSSSCGGRMTRTRFLGIWCSKPVPKAIPVNFRFRRCHYSIRPNFPSFFLQREVRNDNLLPVPVLISLALPCLLGVARPDQSWQDGCARHPLQTVFPDPGSTCDNLRIVQQSSIEQVYTERYPLAQSG